MATVDLRFDFGSGLEGQLQVNGHVVLNASGRTSGDLPPGKHVLQWFLLGNPGETYTVAIDGPDEARFEYNGTMTKDRKTAGFKKFEVGAPAGGGA